MKRREIDRRFDSIVEFSELERYIDNQVKFYSTGMYAKLGFAVAVSFEPDVLLVDEVLAVGDERFQAKCLARIREFQEDGRTIIIVSHAPDVMRSLCDQVAVLDHGRMVALGPAAHSVQAFRHLLFGITPADETQEVDGAGWSKTVTLQIGQVRVEHPAMAERAHLLPREPMVVVVPFTAGGEIDGLLFSVAIYDSRGQLMHMIDTAGQGPMRVGRSGELFFSFEDVPLLEGTYTISVRAVRAADGRPLDLKETAASFDVVSPSRAQGVVHMPSSVELRAGRPSVAASA
jgi:ABC-2 type transport system ATP-binding protein